MYSAQPTGADSATINPAALASDLQKASSRGVKRSRSPDDYQGPPGDDSDKPRKRGRPMKPTKPGAITETPIQPPIVPPPLTVASSSSSSSAAAATAAAAAAATAAAPALAIPPLSSMSSQPLPPHAQAHTAHSPTHPPQPPSAQRSYAPPPLQQPPPPPAGHGPGHGPAPAAPPSMPFAKTPAKPTLKALPTVRDHTTDQLGPGNDEYLPREIDDAGEKKVLQNGHLLGGREYRCRTFLVPQRGDKLFMLATECARVLGYRDSYLLFNKNRSLFKIIANQVEKDDLVGQEILPFSYRSRQIAIVTARSMFRQSGSRVIVGGRRVRDDYWETKARKQGFTEADLAGEKRPGGSKAREAAAAEAAAAAAAAHAQNAPSSLMGHAHPEIVYSSTPGQPFSAAPPSQLVQPDYSDTRSRDYSSILKTGPRQEITGPPYQDRSQASPINEIQQQAHHAADFNRSVSQQRDIRHDYMQSYWRRSHDQPPPPASLTPQQLSTTEAAIPSSRAGTSTSGPAGASGSGMPQPSMVHHSPQMMMTAAPYSQTLNAPSSLPSSIQRSSMPQPPNYNYPQSTQMWPQTPQTPQYSYTPPAPSHAQSHQQAPPPPPPSSQIRHASSSSHVPPSNQMPYSGMPGMSQGYPSQSPAMPYEQTPRQYMHPAGSGSPAVTQGWQGQPQPQPQQPSQWWANQQQ